jgi:hypothetical protein
LVRTLKIRTDGQPRLPRITYLIEDALRTASFPGLPPNGVVYIKSMDLGRFDDRTSSGLLSGRIDAFIRTVQPTRIDRRTADQDDLPAVWFADELEPCRLLAEQLASGHLPRAWFWPVAVKGWSARRPVAKNFQDILVQVVQKSVERAPPAVLTNLAYVLAPLFEKGRILHLLQGLADKPIRGLVTSLGLLPHRIRNEGALLPEEPSLPKGPDKRPYHGGHLKERHRQLIEKAVQCWGVADARSILVAALVLVDREATTGAGRIRRTLVRAAAQTESGRHHPTGASSTAKELPGPTRPPDPPPPRKTTQSPPDTGKARNLTAEKKIRRTAMSEARDENSRSGAPPGARHKIPSSGRTGNNRLRPIIVREADEVPTGAAGHEARCRDEGHAGPPASLDHPDYRDESHRLESLRRQHPFAGTFTRFAGFPLLINVLERLDIESIFVDHPGYPVNGLREAILWRIALWQKLPPDDPAVQFLSNPQLVFKRTAKAHIPVTRQDIFQKARLATQDLFRMPVSKDPSILLGVEAVTAIFIIAVCRYIRREGNLGIRTLIRRPAFVALTKNHMDITASFDTLDIRIRMAGLDVNPGWVPWLGRIIQIHYTASD